MQRTKAQVNYLRAGESIPGGNAPIYLSNNIIRFDDNSKLKSSETFGIDGSMIDLSLVKSRTNKAGQGATLVFNQELGFDPELSLFVLLKDNGRINGAGIGLYIDDRNDIKFSQKNFKTKLADNPELQQIFMNAVVEVLKAQLDSDIKESIDNPDISISNKILEQFNVFEA